MSKGDELYADFENNPDPFLTKLKCYSIRVSCNAPAMIKYNILGCGYEFETNSYERRQLLGRAGGIDSFLEFESYGHVVAPDGFKDKSAELIINPLGSLDRFKLADNGSFGDGHYDGTRFVIRLYLEFAQTQQLLTMLKAQHHQANGESAPVNNITFVLHKLQCQGQDKWTTYEIVSMSIHMYMSRVGAQ